MKNVFSLLLISLLVLLGGHVTAQSAGFPAEAQAAVPLPGQQELPLEETVHPEGKAKKQLHRKRRLKRRFNFSLNLFAGKPQKTKEISPEEKFWDIRAMLSLAKIYGLLWSCGFLLFPGLAAGFLLSPVFLVMTWTVPWKEFVNELPGLQEVVEIGRIHGFILFGFNLIFFMAFFLFIEFSPVMILLLAMMIIASFILSILLTIRANDTLQELNWDPESEGAE